MECENHPGVEPVARCVSCGKHLCASCVRDRGNKLYCSECAPAVYEPDHILVSPEDLHISRAFTYFLEDKRWPQKAVIGVLFMLASLLIVPFFFVLGYQLEIVRSVAAGEDRVLPEWTNLGKMFKEGASLFLIGLVYSIPVLLVVAGVSLLGILVGQPGEGGLRGLLIGVALAGFIVGWLVVVAYAALLRLASPAIAGTYVKTGSISRTLQPGVIVGLIRADIKAYLLVLLMTAFVTGAIAAIGLLACCIGVFVTTFYALLVNAHLIGQLTRLNPVRGDADAG
jgi:hypothetical protein